jgi:hypothetical protein
MSDAWQGSKTLLSQMRERGRNYALYAGREVAQIHVDGIASISSGGVLAHLDLFVTEGIQADPDPELGLREDRVVRARITMPTVQLLEGFVNLLKLLQPQLDNFQSAAQNNAQAVAAQVARLKAIKFENTP